MSWRLEPLPKDWSHIRAGILARDGYRCTWYPGQSVSGHDYTDCYTNPYRCTNKATDVDHIGSSSDHSHENLRSLCSRHHNSKTSSESKQRSKQQRKKNVRSAGGGKFEGHPGML